MANDVSNEISILILDRKKQKAMQRKWKALRKTFHDVEKIDWWSDGIPEPGTPSSDRFRVYPYDDDNVVISAWGSVRYLPRQICHQLHKIDPSVVVLVRFKEEFAQCIGASLSTYCGENLIQISFDKDASGKVGSYLTKRDEYREKDNDDKADEFDGKADDYIDNVLDRCENKAWVQLEKLSKRKREDFTCIV